MKSQKDTGSVLHAPCRSPWHQLVTKYFLASKQTINFAKLLVLFLCVCMCGDKTFEIIIRVTKRLVSLYIFTRSAVPLTLLYLPIDTPIQFSKSQTHRKDCAIVISSISINNYTCASVAPVLTRTKLFTSNRGEFVGMQNSN